MRRRAAVPARGARPATSSAALNEAHRDAQLSGVFYESVFSALAELLGSLALAAIVVGRRWTAPRGSRDLRDARRVHRVRGPVLPARPGAVPALHRHAGGDGLGRADLRAARHRALDRLAAGAAPAAGRAARRDRLRERDVRLRAKATRCSTTSPSAIRAGRAAGGRGLDRRGKVDADPPSRPALRRAGRTDPLDGVDIRDYDLHGPAARRSASCSRITSSSPARSRRTSPSAIRAIGPGRSARPRAPSRADRFIERLPGGYDEAGARARLELLGRGEAAPLVRARHRLRPRGARARRGDLVGRPRDRAATSRRPSRPCSRGGRRSSSPTAWRPCVRPTGSSSCTTAGSARRGRIRSSAIENGIYRTLHNLQSARPSDGAAI